MGVDSGSGEFPSWMIMRTIDDGVGEDDSHEDVEGEEVGTVESFSDGVQEFGSGADGVLRAQGFLRAAFGAASDELDWINDDEGEEDEDGDCPEAAPEEIVAMLRGVFDDGDEEEMDDFLTNFPLSALSAQSPVFDFLFDCLIGEEKDVYGVNVRVQILMLLTTISPDDPRLKEAQIECMYSKSLELKTMAIFAFGTRSEDYEPSEDDFEVLLRLLETESNPDVRLEIVVALLGLRFSEAYRLLDESELLDAFNKFFVRDFDFQHSMLKIVSSLSRASQQLIDQLFRIAFDDRFEGDFKPLVFLKIVQLADSISVTDMEAMACRIAHGERQTFFLAVAELRPDSARDLFESICSQNIEGIDEEMMRRSEAKEKFPMGPIIDHFDLGEYSAFDVVVANACLGLMELNDYEQDDEGNKERIKMLVRGAALKPHMHLDDLKIYWEATYEAKLSSRTEGDNLRDWQEDDLELLNLEIFGNSLHEDPEFQEEVLELSNEVFMLAAEVLDQRLEQYGDLILEVIENEMELGVYNPVQMKSLELLKQVLFKSEFEG